MKPKIYISHRDLSVEEVAKMVGVSKRRTKELIALAAEINGSTAARSVKSKGKPHARKKPRRNVTVEGAQMKPKIYISHPDPSIEEVAKMVGVSKRRLKELKVIIADVIEAEAPRRSRRAGKQSAHKRSKAAAIR